MDAIGGEFVSLHGISLLRRQPHVASFVILSHPLQCTRPCTYWGRFHLRAIAANGRGMTQGSQMRVDHVSVAVNSIDRALAFFRAVFPLEMRAQPCRGYTDDFNWCDFYIGQFKLELIEATRPDSFVRRFIDKRGEGLHHLSLEVNH